MDPQEGLALAEKAVELAEKGGAGYADSRVEYASSYSVRAAKGSVEASGLSEALGLAVRVHLRGHWGFAFTENLGEAGIRDAVDRALRLARSISGEPRGVALGGGVKARFSADVKVDPRDVSPEEKVSLVLDADRELRREGIVDDRVRYSDVRYWKAVASSDGAEALVEGSRVRVLLYAVAGRGGVKSPALEVVAKTGGLEVLRAESPIERAAVAAERALRLLDAPVPRGGYETVILDNDLVGMIVHEAFGHTAEADFVSTGSILAGRIGERLAAEEVSIVDAPGPKDSYGWTPVDDEGVAGREVRILDHGVLRGYMHSRQTAAEMGVEPTGNGRAQDYAHAPLVRMRTTYMEPGTWKRDEIIGDTEKGLYLVKSLHGESDMNGNFMFVVQEAWEIRGGEPVRPYRGVTISGNSLDVLASIDAVGDDFMIASPGVCGKLQLVPVDGGGPHVRTRLYVGGKA